MAGIKSLIKDTAIYGVSSIIGRFLNWCLVPLYTYMFVQAQYGIVTNIYAYVAVLLILLTMGMETGFFRFSNHERWTDPRQVYSTTLISIGTVAGVFALAVCLLSGEIAGWLNIPDHPEYIIMMGVTVAIDAFTSIPFCYLRYKKRAIRFASIKLVNIGVNIGLNLFFLVLCPKLQQVCPGVIDKIYNPDFGIGYIFLSNLISSTVVLLCLTPQLRVAPNFCGKLLKEMLHYSFPLLVLGLAGIMNQTIDKILFPFLYPDRATADAQLGIYGACYKVAVVMVMFIQAFRFAYEPFIFERAKQAGEDKRQSYADAMKIFIIFSLVIFLGVMFYLGILRYIISPRYFEGLSVVPIVMLAELFFGIFFNLSLWYKLTDRTIWGTIFSVFGLVITLSLNCLLVPRYGYIGCAWAAFACYGSMMLASWLVGRKYYPINYDLRRIGLYVGLAAIVYVLGIYLIEIQNEILNYVWRTLLLLGFIAVVIVKEKPFAVLRRKSPSNG